MRLLASIALVMMWTLTSAQSFTARVNRTNVSVDENFQLIFECSGDGERFSPPPLDDFMLLSGPNKSSNMQWVNGNFSSSVSYSFILRPKDVGEFVIGPASIKVDDKVLETDPIKMTVSQGRQRSSTPQQSVRPGQSQTQARQTEEAPDDVSSNVFLKLFVTDKDVYVGEQLLATYKLYLSVNVVDYDFSNLVFNGFYSEDLKIDVSKGVATEVINGRQFQVHTLKQTLLTPQKSGKIEIPALESEMVIQVRDGRRQRSLFDQVFGNYRNARISLKSNTESINVRALPTADQPSDFTGAVGEFSLKATVDHDEVGTNEAVNVNVQIEGKGNLDLISPPKVEFPTDFESYDPKVKNNVSTSASGSRGSKGYEYVVIPRYAGEYEIGPVTFSFFNPATESYIRLKADPIQLTVNASGDEEGGVAYVAPKKEDVQIIGKDIRFIHTESPDLRRKESRCFGSLLFYMLCILPFMAMGAAIYGYSFYRAQHSDSTSVKSRRARGMAKKHLAEAKKRLSGDDGAFYEAISSALFGYIADKLAIPRSDLNRERIEDELRSRGVSDALQQELKKALDECEMVRFAPGVVRGKQEMLDASVKIIEALEDEL